MDKVLVVLYVRALSYIIVILGKHEQITLSKNPEPANTVGEGYNSEYSEIQFMYYSKYY